MSPNIVFNARLYFVEAMRLTGNSKGLCVTYYTRDPGPGHHPGENICPNESSNLVLVEIQEIIYTSYAEQFLLYLQLPHFPLEYFSWPSSGLSKLSSKMGAGERGVAQNYILTPCFKLPQGLIAEESADFKN